MHALPLSGRQFVELTLLTAGFTGSPDFPNAQGQFPLDPAACSSTARAVSPRRRGASRGFYSGHGLESIQQVRVFTSAFRPKSESLRVGHERQSHAYPGTDTWHGSALLFQARRRVGCKAGILRHHPASQAGEQFAASVGGLIHHQPD